MSNYNLSTGYGLVSATSKNFTLGKTFYVVGATYAGYDNASRLYRPDSDGVNRFFAGATAVTSALAQCVTGRNDFIIIDPSYSTALTAAELLAAETKGVTIVPVGKSTKDGTFFADRATGVLPASKTESIFTVTGRVRLMLIIGEVTVAIQNQADSVKIINTPTVGSATDICAAANVANAAVGAQFSITGTFADAMIITNAPRVHQASSIILKPGTIDLNTTATNTGSVKWKVIYEPIDQGAMIIPA